MWVILCNLVYSLSETGIKKLRKNGDVCVEVKKNCINQAHTDCRKYLSSTFLKIGAKRVSNSATEGLGDSCEVGVTTVGKIFLWRFSASSSLFS